LQQTMLRSPTVFNFFDPHYAEAGAVSDAGIVSPELEIIHATTITLVLLSMIIVTWLAIVMTIIAAWLLWRSRAALREALRSRTAAPAPAAAT